MNRGATVFLVVAAVLAVVAYVLLGRMTPSNQPRVGDALFDFGSDDIRSIVITSGEGITEIRRTDSGWQLAPEPIDRASEEFVARVLETARTTPVLDRIPAAELDGDAGQFGLKKSRQRLDFRGDGVHSLLFGKDTADESRVYVRFEDAPDVLVISDELADLVFRKREDYRDRRVSSLRPGRVERFVIRRPDGEMDVRLEAGAWRIVKPYRVSADEEAVSTFLGKLLATGIREFVPESPDNAAALPGEGTVTVELYAEGESVPEVLVFGTTAQAGGVTASSSSRSGTFMVPEAAASLVEEAPSLLRDRAIARINLDLVDEIRVERDGSSLVLHRSEGGWAADGRPVAADAVERLRHALATTMLEDPETATGERLATAGLVPPAVRITFSSIVSENTPEAPAGSQTVADVFLSRPDASGRVAVHVAGSPEFGRAAASLLEVVPAAP